MNNIRNKGRYHHAFQVISERGCRRGYYDGEIGEAVVEAVKNAGGVLSVEDLASHDSEILAGDRLLSATYKGRCRLWELPPNGDGLAALIALKIMERLLLGVTG